MLAGVLVSAIAGCNTEAAQPAVVGSSGGAETTTSTTRVGASSTSGGGTTGTTDVSSSGSDGDSGGSGSGDATGTGVPPPPGTPTFVKSWGELGTEPGQFVEPSSVELDSLGNVYVAGHEDRLQKFTRDGRLLQIIGTSGAGDGEFNHPHGLAMDRVAGLLYAGDQENNRVQVFTTDGVFVRLWTDSQFQHIHDVGIDPIAGDIYVGDLESNVMQKFTSAGQFVLEFGGTGNAPGQFSGVWGLSTDSTGRVYVADSGNARVQVFTADGTYQSEWSGFVKPTGVFVDAQDEIYVCDSLADEVLVFDTQGQLEQTWDLTAIVGSPSEPEDIVISVDGVHLYLGDVLNHRVLYLTRG